MSTTSLRAIAAGLTAIVAVLTGFVSGLVGAGKTCVPAADTPPNVCKDTRFDGAAAAAGFGGAVLAGGLATVMLFLRRPPAAAPPTPTAPVAAGGPDPERLARAEHDRVVLIKVGVYLHDRLAGGPSRALADSVGRALHEVGVIPIAPVGDRFDPAHHEAGGVLPTRDAGKAGTIATIEMPGYADRGVVLRAPVVTVYREEK